MSFSGTQVFTINSVGKTLVKINQDKYSSEYLLRETDAEYRAKIRHNVTTRDGVKYDRHNVEITKTIFATSTDPEYQERAYVVFENLPKDDEATYVPDALAAWLQASAGANLTALVGWES